MTFIQNSIAIHRVIVFLCATFCSSAFGAASTGSGEPTAPDRVVIVHAGTLLDVPGQQPKSEQSLIIRNGVIVKVASRYLTADEVGSPGAEIIDLKSRFVLPGLMDMHVHLVTEGLDYATLATRGEADNALIAAEMARRTLMAGFTTVRDQGAFGDAVFAVQNAVDEGLIPGPRIFASGGAISATAGHGHIEDYFNERVTAVLPWNDSICDSPHECRKAVREQIRRGADVIKIMAGGGGREDNGFPAAPAEMFDDEIVAAVEASHGMLRTISAHAHSTAAINAALRAGVDSIDHGSFMDDESIKLFKKTGAYLVPTSALAYGRKITPESLDAMPEALRQRQLDFMNLKPVWLRKAYEAGVKIAAGTDSGIMAHGLNARELFQYVESVGMTEMEAIVTATINTAVLLRQEDNLGTL